MMEGSGHQTRRRSARQAELQEQREAKRLRRGSLETNAGILEEESVPVIVSTESFPPEENSQSASDTVEIGGFEVVRVKLEGDKRQREAADALGDMEKACGTLRSYLEEKAMEGQVLTKMLEDKDQEIEKLTKEFGEHRQKTGLMQGIWDEVRKMKDLLIIDLKSQLESKTSEAELITERCKGLVENVDKMSAEMEGLRNQLKSQNRGMEVLRSDNQRLTQTLQVNNLEIDKLKGMLLVEEISQKGIIPQMSANL